MNPVECFLIAVAVLGGGLAFRRMWRRDRPWRGVGHFTGLLSISAVVAIVVYFAANLGIALLIAATWPSG